MIKVDNSSELTTVHFDTLPFFLRVNMRRLSRHMFNLSSLIIRSLLIDMKCYWMLTLLAIMCTSVTSAGELHEFEKDAIFKRGSNSAPLESEKGDDCGLILLLLTSCGDRDYQYTHNEESKAYFSQTDALSDGPNAPAVFSIIADLQYQKINTHISTINLNFEVSNGRQGIHGLVSNFFDSSSADDLQYIQVHGLYKPLGQRNFSLSLGVGIGSLRGKHTTSGFSIYIPIRYKLNRIFSAEAHGSITSLNQNPIIDTRLSIKVGYQRTSLVLSYLSFHSPGESLHGPALGVSYTFN